MARSKQIISHEKMSQDPTHALSVIQANENTFNVLKETLYPGSTDAEVRMILGYCAARRIDPILKPVHLVPMDVKTDKKDKDGKFVYEKKNVIMPGIGLYRIDASRSGQYAGMSEPEFGQDITENLGKEKVKVTYPKWCKITVKKRLESGEMVEFTAKEFWKENYASKSKWDAEPNYMWSKRAYGQLAKCTEAQALRKAFPDIVGNEYTKEEMEGKSYADEPREREKVQTNDANPVIEGETIRAASEADFIAAMDRIKTAETEENLKDAFNDIKKLSFATGTDFVKQLLEAKDKRKGEILVRDFNIETGEVTDEQ